MTRLILLLFLIFQAPLLSAESYTQYGNTTYGSDGTSYSTYGNTTYGSDGTSCTQYGNTVYCN